MASVNKVILIGNLGRDPETRYTADGAAITNISIATTRRYKDASGQQQEETEWHRVSFFGRLAEIAGEYLRKGSKVYIEGRLQTRKWQDKEGHDRYSTEIIANDMQMLDGRGSAGDAPDIDGVVRIRHPGKSRVGEMIEVAITAADHYDLEARVIAGDER